MNNFFKNIQNKPESIKRMVMRIGIFIIMSVILTFWILTFPSPTPESVTDEATAKIQKNLPNAWESLKSQISEIKNLWVK